VTVYIPVDTAGTANPQVKPPEASVVNDPEPHDAICVVANVRVIPARAAKPVPVAVTELPTEPEVGLTVSFAVTVYVVEAVTLEPSVATTDSAPFGVAGTWMVQAVPEVPGKLPDESEVHVEATDAPLNVNAMDEEAVKPVPVAVVWVPTEPEEGETARVAVTKKFAVPLFEPSVAVTCSVPCGTIGTLNVQLVNVPNEPVEHADPAAVTAATVNVIDEVAA
jgi:hypothetical protein